MLPRPEVWGGVECTVNRVDRHYHDQLEKSGHAHRADDIDLIAELGIRTLRYPLLWERTAPDGIESADWSWPDERLKRLRAHGIRPVAGLLHHGSGPRYTDLLDPGFPEKLAAYARACAERYPWVEMYTPVNEPLTTARFSGLYGHWYPHHRNDLSFVRALLGECRGTILAMREIREVNPDAKLVQTEDLGKTWSTPRLAYQAAFENGRRWLTFDILTGSVGREHPMREYLVASGVTERELEWFASNALPPDIVGINHYLTSERFLDERLHRYPSHTHGGNGRDRYADIEAVRVLDEGVAGPCELLGEAWERYGIPLAVTEVHLGCTIDEQLRWLRDVYDAACRLYDAGADVRAVTVWSLFGAYDWDSLLTSCRGNYEPGAFDVGSGSPRPTELASMVRALAHGTSYRNPALESQGWWRRPERLLYPPARRQPHGTERVAEMTLRPMAIAG